MTLSDYSASRLKLLRKSLKLTQADMASCLNMEQSTYSRYESGRTQLPLYVIQLIAEKYGISPSEFFSPDTGSAPAGQSLTRMENAGIFYPLPKELIDKIVFLLESISNRLKPGN